MKVLDEKEFDRALRSGSFFKIYDREENMPAGHYEAQQHLNDKLIAFVETSFKKDSYFVNDNVWPNESLICDFATTNLNRQGIELLKRFLHENAPGHAIYGGAYRDDLSNGEHYLGRYVVTSKGLVAVEASFLKSVKDRVAQLLDNP